MRTVSNTSPISNLAWIGRLDFLLDQFQEIWIDFLLDQFQEIWIPIAVETELQNVPDPAVRKAVDEAKRRGWLKSRPASDAALVSLLTLELHPGEAEAIALALEMKAEYLLIDEREGRALARQLGLPITAYWVCCFEPKKGDRLRPSSRKLKRSGERLDSSSRPHWKPPF